MTSTTTLNSSSNATNTTQENAKADSTLVWEDCGAGEISGDRRNFKAPAARGTYHVIAGTDLLSMKFAGYIVEYRPDGNRKNARCIKSGVATAAIAKAAAQADYVSEAHKSENQVARPLHVLTPLIAKDLKAGNEAAKEAAKQAGMPYYRGAGEKLLEAKAQIPHGEFEDWIKRNFKLSARTAREYMSFARTTANIQNGSALPFSSLRDHDRQTSTRRDPSPTSEYIAQQHQRLIIESRKSIEEREAKRELGLELIKRGYKSLAKEFHSDKGGTDEAMVRLNWVRNHLRNMA